MPNFRYKAATAGGETVDGEIDADSRARAVAQLQSQGYIPIRIDEVRAQSTSGRLLSLRLGEGGRRVSAKEITLITSELATLLRAEGCTLSEATVGRILRRLRRSGRLIEPKRRVHRRPRPLRPHATRKPAAYQPQRPGDLVQIDTVHLALADGSQLRQFSAIDVVSRVAAVEVRTRATAGTAAAFVDDLLDRFPVRIRAIQVDGGSEFMAEFEEICAANAIPLYVLPPRSPKLNGCVERFNRTSREEFWECYVGTYDLASVQPALRAWEDEYNRLRPHQSLGMHRPVDFLAAAARTQQSSM